VPRTSLQDIRSLADPLQQFNWDLVIPRMPGTGDSREFTFKAMTTSIPGMLLEQVPVNLHGMELRYAGRKNYSHALPVTILETSDISTRDMFVSWSELARSWLANTGSPKSIYGTNIILKLYDDTPAERKVITLVGAWPETVDDAALDGQASGIVTYSITFSYDFPVDGVALPG
jgi:hypothetical protein